MLRLPRILAAFVVFLWAQGALSQSWVQIEARPSEAQGLDRALAWASELNDVNGFRLASGWYAIALGPFATEDLARNRLLQLRAARAVPNDSFVSDGGSFRERFFGSDTAQVAPAEPLPPLVPGEETPEEARRSERLLTRDERAEIQVALKWEGFYTSIIDASFGPGTRRAMAAWQEGKRYEPTGILTTLQRRELVDAYRDVLASLDMTLIQDTEAGIEIEIPAGLVEFGRYEPPFAHYRPLTDDKVRVLLISQTGGRDSLAALYDIMQTLRIVPMEGPRQLNRSEFTLVGEGQTVVSHTFARLAGDAIKGFTLIWPVGDEPRRNLALDAMRASFRTNSGVLPDTLDGGAQDIDLLSGLKIRRAERTGSGFFIDSSGAVLTSLEAVASCQRITLNDETSADVVARDADLGLALLRPSETLAPLSVARLAAAEPRIQSDVAVAGFSFGGILTAPSVTFGTLADVKGLDGDNRVKRLALNSAPGDVGGPVFDGTGAVLGMLLPRSSGSRQLPGDVAFAAKAYTLAEFLATNGVSPAASDTRDAMAPEDLTLLASDLTVLVSCWNE